MKWICGVASVIFDAPDDRSLRSAGLRRSAAIAQFPTLTECRKFLVCFSTHGCCGLLLAMFLLCVFGTRLYPIKRMNRSGCLSAGIKLCGPKKPRVRWACTLAPVKDGTHTRDVWSTLRARVSQPLVSTFPASISPALHVQHAPHFLYLGVMAIARSPMAALRYAMYFRFMDDVMLAMTKNRRRQKTYTQSDSTGGRTDLIPQRLFRQQRPSRGL